MHGTSLFFIIQHSESLSFCGDPCHGETKPKQQVTALLACVAEDKLLPHVTGKYRSLHCFKSKKLPTKYGGSANSWITSRIFEVYLTQPNKKVGAKNKKKMLLFIFYCSIKGCTISQEHKECVLCSWLYQLSAVHSSAVTEGSSFKRLLPC
jgi:hypothetical protein